MSAAEDAQLALDTSAEESASAKIVALPTYTKQPNAMVDDLLPHVSLSAWAVLSVIVRRTCGYHCESAVISLLDFMRSTPIASKVTILSALDELKKLCVVSIVVDGKGRGATSTITLRARHEWQLPCKNGTNSEPLNNGTESAPLTGKNGTNSEPLIANNGAKSAPLASRTSIERKERKKTQRRALTSALRRRSQTTRSSSLSQHICATSYSRRTLMHVRRVIYRNGRAISISCCDKTIATR